MTVVEIDWAVQSAAAEDVDRIEDEIAPETDWSASSVSSEKKKKRKKKVHALYSETPKQPAEE